MQYQRVDRVRQRARHPGLQVLRDDAARPERAKGQLAVKAGVPVAGVKDVIIWGNHSPKMFPDVSRATVNGESASGRFDQEWLRGDFLKTVSTRGKAIINARGASSAASAANAAVEPERIGE